MKTLFKNGLIYDGTGAPAFRGDILVNGDRIDEVGSEIQCAEATVVDLKGASVSSGFIDAHSHNDWFAIKKEPLKYFEPFIRQGITSFITGNCGLSAIGFEEDCKETEKIGGGLFSYHDTTGIYPDAQSFFDAIDGKMPCNIATLVGHCSARTSVSSWENRPLTTEENERMLAVMEKSLQQGACGLSLGLMYAPGIYAPTDELKGIVKLCEKYDRPLTVHPRAESTFSMSYPELLGRSHILRAMDELYEITKGTKCKLEYSHMIFVGRSSFKVKDALLAIVDKMHAEGVQIGFDIYAELLGVSVITVVMPAWYQALSAQEKRQPWNKFKFEALIKATTMLLGFGWPDIVIAYVGEGNEQYEGKTVAQIAKEMGKSCADAYLDLCEMSNFQGRVNMGPYSTPEIITEQSKRSDVLYMTDAWVEDYGVQNPAIYDCFPKFLKFSLDGAGDTMPMTVRKMTGAVADRFSLKQRGYVKPGYYADLTVFNEESLKKGIPDRTCAFGIEQVWINGTCVLKDNDLNREALAHTGRAMRA